MTALRLRRADSCGAAPPPPPPSLTASPSGSQTSLSNMRAALIVLFFPFFTRATATHDAADRKKLPENPYATGGVLRRLQYCSAGTWQCGSGSCAGCCSNSCSSCTCSTCTNCGSGSSSSSSSYSSSSSSSLSGGAIVGIIIAVLSILSGIAVACARAGVCNRQVVMPPVPPPHLNLATPPALYPVGTPDPALHYRVAVCVQKSGPLGLQLAPAPAGVGVEVSGLPPGALVEGLLLGDRLLSVGGAPALLLPLGDANALLQQAPRPLLLEFLRRNDAAPPPPPCADDPAQPTIAKEATLAAAAAAAPPDPSQHHTVACSITRPGLVGMGLAPAPGGAGVVVDSVAPNTAIAPAPKPGDRVFSINGVVLLMAPFPHVIAALQGAPRPAPISFLRKNGAQPTVL